MAEVKAKIESAFDLRDNGKPEQSFNQVPLSDEELDYRRFLIKRLEEARDAREQEREEFDDMTYSEWYDSNARAANSYNKPKDNPEDTRIVTGTTQEKANTLLSALLNYNLEPNVSAFNKNNIRIVDLGETMEALILKSRKMENYEEKRPLIYKELLDQGTCFVEEVKTEQIFVDKKLKGDSWKNGTKLSKIKWETKLKKLYAECEVNLIEGKKVYLGNVREFSLEKQPYAFIVDVIPYDQAKYLYGDWERWEMVPKKVVKMDNIDSSDKSYRDWSLLEIAQERVEVIKYQDPLNNEFQIFLNGVMMLPIEFPLTAISPSGSLTFGKGDIQPISKFFAYSKSVPAKTKVDQALLDEFLRLMVLKTQKSFMPPMANKSNKVLSRKIFFPGKITNNLNPGDLDVIGDASGVTNSEFNVFELLKRIVDEKTVSPTFGGDASTGGTTATEIVEMKKQQMMKLGATILGVIALERQLSELRLYNVLNAWTDPIDERVDEVKGEIQKIYRTVTIEGTMEDGKEGEQIIAFDPDKASMPSEDIMGMEDYIKKHEGRDVRITYLNPEELRTIEVNWNISIVPTERESSALDRVLFVQSLNDAGMLFGAMSTLNGSNINMDYAKERFALLAGEDPEKFFKKEQPQPQMPQGVPGAEGQPAQTGAGVPADLAKTVGAGIQAPSLNTLANA